jgi:hypothetical protein
MFIRPSARLAVLDDRRSVTVGLYLQLSYWTCESVEILISDVGQAPAWRISVAARKCWSCQLIIRGGRDIMTSLEIPRPIGGREPTLHHFDSATRPSLASRFDLVQKLHSRIIVRKDCCVNYQAWATSEFISRQ